MAKEGCGSTFHWLNHLVNQPENTCRILVISLMQRKSSMMITRVKMQTNLMEYILASSVESSKNSQRNLFSNRSGFYRSVNYQLFTLMVLVTKENQYTLKWSNWSNRNISRHLFPCFYT